MTQQPDPVGLVAGTSDSTPLRFSVAVGPGAYLQLDDVVTTQRDVPGVGSVRTSGVVTQVVARHEGASFGSDARSDGKCDGKRQGYNGNHDARHDVFRKLLLEFFFAAVLDNAE